MKLLVTSSPHIHSGTHTSRLMGAVLAALLPALVAGVWFFGLRSLALVGVTVLSCLLSEWVFRKLTRQSNTLPDLSAAVTGVLLAMTLPATIPYWMAALGAVFAIVALGVGFLSGLLASPVDMRLSTDTYCREANLYDIKIQSTQGLTDEEVENLEQINTELEQKLRMDDYDVDDISETDMMLHKAIAETTHNSLVVMIHDFVADLTSESRHRTIEKVFEENDREYLVRTHRMALDALEKKPGSDVDEALRYSYYYWKDSYNW